MVSKASSRQGSRQAIDYILSDKVLGKAVELDRNGVIGRNGTEILNEMRFVQSTNKRCLNNTISLIISPNPDVGKNLTNGQLREILHKQLEYLGLKEHQYISTSHNSTGKVHIHAIINRICKKKAYNDSWISKRAQIGAESIALALGWKTASAIQNEVKQEREIIKKSIGDLLKENKVTSFDQFLELLDKNGLAPKKVFSKVTGKLSGYTIKGHKASEIDRKLTVGRIESLLQNSGPNLKEEKQNINRSYKFKR
ncbi:relaxase/mobilization nuclease domain-containing protein [Sphingobacterium rhinopitheci]|uniref:relaxase/mobilization nuclease domain-containing protein n=1 Tax=Sphingobacterium rhinopitheci TaxID=2781960 RepID=UPI001F523806|nr:relaxase/mobilization nuclease domain-containing protein [Sphingobacterium rhinopitheci]MCI0920552.1 relaxase/mobilization nuclease domain-containing protein [Sphingobacterium rhinopitheci]